VTAVVAISPAMDRSGGNEGLTGPREKLRQPGLWRRSFPSPQEGPGPAMGPQCSAAAELGPESLRVADRVQYSGSN
jgi:hypothetical protein